MTVINILYKPLDTVQSRYFFGYTGGESPKQVATSKQLWKIQDLSNRLYHYYLCIEAVAEDKVNNKQIIKQMKETKQAIDDVSSVSLPCSKENMDKKIKLLTQLLESTLPKLHNIVEESIQINSA
jgi:hypothetical protein